MLFRAGRSEDLQSVYMLGYDIWGDGDLDRYLAGCEASPKYKSGEWFVLDVDGEIVSALICYQNLFSLPEGAVGIGSIATHPLRRQKGYASVLIQETLAHLGQRDAKAVFLFSDIGTGFYKKFGFYAYQNGGGESDAAAMRLDFLDTPMAVSQKISYF